MHTFTNPGNGHALRAALTATVALSLLLGPGVGAVAAPTDPTTGPIGGSRLAGAGVIVDASAPALPWVSSRSWVLAEATTGAVLAARGPHERARPASTLKTLLALTMLTRLQLWDRYTAKRSDVKVEGTRVGLIAGQSYLVDDLFYGLFLKSGNDAANAVAHAGSTGTIKAAVAMMQAEARRLQANDTTVVNANGLDEPGQFTSAYDLALWGRAAIARSDVRRYTSTRSKLFPTKPRGRQKQYRIYTTNRMLGVYPGAFGVKTGYTTLARNTLIAAAERNGRTLIVTLMGSNGATAPQAGRLLDWGFANRLVRPVGQLVSPMQASAAPTSQQKGDASRPAPATERAARPRSGRRASRSAATRSAR